MNRRTFVKRSLVATAAAGLAGAGYGRYVERHAVEVVEVKLDLGLPEPRTVALLGDIHFDPLYETDYLEDVVARVNALSADLVLYTGDFLSRTADRLADLVSILGRVKGQAVSYAILGNHDHRIGADAVTAALGSVGIDVLRNQSVPLPGRGPWYLTGLESYWTGSPNTHSIEGTPADARHIVLAHEPDSFDLLTDSRIALQLSGHTHGGQIHLPFAGAVCLPSWGKKYPAGLYGRAGQRLYVNRGIGTVDEHYRLNCRPEITHLRIT